MRCATLLCGFAIFGLAVGEFGAQPAAAQRVDARQSELQRFAVRKANAQPVRAPQSRAQPGAQRVLDQFDTLNGWGAFPAEGVALTLLPSAGVSGGAMTMRYDFQGKAGYAIARKKFDIGTPVGNWSFSFKVRGAMRPNTIEFKLLDKSGENVWWHTFPEFRATNAWQTLVIRERQTSFAWGPVGGGAPRDIAAIEIVVTAGQGGSGSLTIDDLVFTPLPTDVPVTTIASVSARGTLQGSSAQSVIDGDSTSTWRAQLGTDAATIKSAPGGRGGKGSRVASDASARTGGDTLSPSLTLDLGGVRTYGGLVIDWARGEIPARVIADSSNDGVRWNVAGALNGIASARSYLPIPDGSSRYLRLRFDTVHMSTAVAASTAVVGIRSISVRPLEFAATPTTLLHSMAQDAPRGNFPRSMHDEQIYWSIVGVSGGQSEALLSEDGQLELAKRGPSLEPFLSIGNRLITWADVTATQSLLDDIRPIPSVTWRADNVTLAITAFAAGTQPNSSIYARYRVINRANTPLSATLAIALRPLQVNPPWQFLNTPGGAARVDSLSWNGSVLRVNDALRIEPLTSGAQVGVTTFDAGEATSYIAQQRVPTARHAIDTHALGSAVMSWPVNLAPNDSTDVVIATRLDGNGDPQLVRAGDARLVRQATNARMAQVARTWAADQDAVTIHLPASAPPIAAALKANLAWILINRDGPGIQPGSRSYERSWIRDGSLTAEALLRLGRSTEAKQFAEWYANFQYPSGKIPCCVDKRGADPVDEHDSHGEFIHLVYEIWRFTGDRAFAERMWPHVKLAAQFIDSLRARSSTPAFNADSVAFRGLLPASISHEGYSAKPMHSIWDDGFAVLGLREAEALAKELGKTLPDASTVASSSATMGNDLAVALDRTMRTHSIPYFPGSIELADFDATSTTTLLTPGGFLPVLPRVAFDSTFARYYKSARARTNPDSSWENYTPYEWRTVGALLRLDKKDEALTMVNQFMGDRRPLNWQQWAEVVWHDKRAPKFLGDMPHTWVGSDFIRSALDLFAFEHAGCGSSRAPNESISPAQWASDYARPCLVIGAGIPIAWTPPGDSMFVRGLRTPWGPLGYSMRVAGKTVTIRIDAGLRIPPLGIVLRTPFSTPIVAATVDGKASTSADLVTGKKYGAASFVLTDLTQSAHVIVLTHQ